MERKQGISLVALIITIIVLIILTGAVIITMNQGNTIEKSEEAVFKSDLTNFRDQLVMKILDKQAKMEITGKGDAILNNVTGNDLREWVPSITDKYIGKLAIKEGNLYYTDTTNEQEYGWAAEIDMIDISSTLAGKVEVGDYIEYRPGVGSYEAIRDKTGHSADQIFTSTEAVETWRVLSIEGTNVTIMRGEPTTELTLLGQAGYNNAEEVLNGICGIYKNEAYARSARSITIEDINKVTGYVIPEESTFNNSGEYGSIGYGGNKCTYYGYSGLENMPNIESKSDFKYTMIFENDNKNYWAASCCVGASSDDAGFLVRGVNGGGVDASILYVASGVEYGSVLGVRPVVVLKSTVQLSNEAGQDGTSDNPWELQ